MIISRVLIRDYKQYVGEHDIAIPSSATIGVIGANGVGKTTLFEAIEWALYGTGVASARDVRPRGRSGSTTVSITLDLPGTGEQYIVERELKRSSASAVVYKVEPDGEEVKIVTGTSPVNDFVQSTLIGLDHKAFTATFFTRQKELGFFGDLGDAARRREVGKLLGLETIRIAQQKIGEDRLQARNNATVLEKQYETQSKGHDFPAEITAAEEVIAASQQQLAVAHKDVDAATLRVTALDKDLAGQQALKDRDGQFATRLVELRGQSHAATQQRDTCTSDLARLDARAKEREALLPKAQALPALEAQVRELEEKRAVHQQRQQLHQALLAHERRRGDVINSLRSLVTEIVPPSPVDGWTWGNGDSEDPISAAIRCVTAIGTVDISAAERREQSLQRLRSLATDRAKAQQDLKRYEDARKNLLAQLAQKTADGDPAEALKDAQQRMQDLQRDDLSLKAQVEGILPQQQKITRLMTNLRQQDMNEPCPTCGRPFSPGDVADTLALFEQQVAALKRQVADLEAKRQQVTRQRQEAQAAVASLETRAGEIRTLKQRIEASAPYIDDQSKRVNELDNAIRTEMRALDRDSLPDEHEITRVSVEVQTWRRMIDARGHITRYHSDIVTIDAELTPVRRDLEGIGEVHYDEQEHRKVALAHQDALKAATTVSAIDRELARRAQIEADLAAAREKIATLAGEIAALEKERAAVGFDAAKLAAVAEDLRKAREEREVAIEMRHRVGSELVANEHVLARLVEERERIADLAKEAEAQRHLHDRLDQMYREFDEFDRYAAAWYAPRLGEITSELVAEVTDGKYDRVVFDNNFGIEIYDGEDEKFPLETFSGGERDAIALCARIALSRVIGSTGTQPPGFLVLDEVFGSLDLDRRQHLLDMLGRITGSGEHFRQVFIISHVDDVRTSPIFDELWQIVENDEGSSELRALGHGSDIGEL